ncbi:hypothetical protein C8J57DRAFT_1463665 [Mycena rebaudengoi]|nr:hypothetical protein C8J57DRAFT_1463665 [Mycena rebaudengoi]
MTESPAVPGSPVHLCLQTLQSSARNISTLMNHPFSRGTIHIVSDDALKPRFIDPYYFEEDYEQNKFARKLPSVVDQPRVTCSNRSPILLPCPLADGGVVDNQLKVSTHSLELVYHTTNIRVVDISLQIGAHLQATTYAVGELAADIIKGKVGVPDG